MALIVLAALTGLFGKGALSRANATAPDSGLSIEYPRFDRHRSPQTFRVHLTDPSSTDDGEVRMVFDRSFLEDVEIHAVYPEPDSVIAGAEGVAYLFKVEPGGLPTFVFNYFHESIGPAKASVSLEGRAPVDFSHFVYP